MTTEARAKQSTNSHRWWLLDNTLPLQRAPQELVAQLAAVSALELVVGPIRTLKTPSLCIQDGEVVRGSDGVTYDRRTLWPLHWPTSAGYRITRRPRGNFYVHRDDGHAFGDHHWKWHILILNADGTRECIFHASRSGASAVVGWADGTTLAYIDDTFHLRRHLREVREFLTTEEVQLIKSVAGTYTSYNEQNVTHTITTPVPLLQDLYFYEGERVIRVTSLPWLRRRAALMLWAEHHKH